MARLRLNHLETLAAISKSKSLAQAAVALSITPSALTHRLREAERRLGVTLFEKSGRALRPTAAAQILTLTGERILADLEKSERVAVASTLGVRHIVRMTVAVYNAFHWLPGFLSWFRTRHPTIEIEIEANSALSPFDSLSRDQVDLVISPDEVLPGALDTMDLFDDELVVVVWPQHPFATRDYVNGRDFLHETYLTYSLLRQPGYEADRLWAAEKTLPFREHNIGSVEAVCELVKAQVGISVLSRWGAHPHFASGSLIPVQATADGLRITWRAVTKSGWPADSPVRTFARALAEWHHGDIAKA